MLSLSSSQHESSQLLSHARLTIESLIQRPNTITTSNAFDEFSILDNLIDVSNDVDRFEDGESRKFLNIAQLITASACIYSRRVDALYKLINTFQSTPSSDDETISDEESLLEPIISDKSEENQSKKTPVEKKKKPKEPKRSFICQDVSKINLNPSKSFFLDRTSLTDLKIFQKNVPSGNKQFWMNDNQPVIFNLLFPEQSMIIEETIIKQEPEQLIDVLSKISPIKHNPISTNDNDIPLPLPAYDNENDESSANNQNISNENEISVEKKKPSRNRRKKVKVDLNLNMFRIGLTNKEQECFYIHKMKPISNKIKVEQNQFFNKKFNRNHFQNLIKDSASSIMSIFIYPTIIIQHLTIRERYSMINNSTYSRTIRSPSIPLADVLNDNALMPIPSSPISSFIYDFNEDVQEDVDDRLQSDMEQIVDAAAQQSNEEQEHNKVFLELRSSIMSYMNEHDSMKQINVDDLLGTLHNHYCLPLVFSQLLHLCGATQRYSLHSTSSDNLFIEKIL